MPHETFVYVGAYAVFMVPVAVSVSSEETKELAREVLDGEALFIPGVGWPEVEVEGRMCWVYYGLAWEDRPNAPARPIRARANRDTYGSLFPFEPTDLRSRDCEAEITWFRSAFATELDRAAAYFGQPPVFRWGIVIEEH